MVAGLYNGIYRAQKDIVEGPRLSRKFSDVVEIGALAH